MKQTAAIMFVATVLGACGERAPKSTTDAAATVQDNSFVEGRVQICHDGDTCVVRLADQAGTLKIRFIGIDAPEVSGGADGEGQPLGIAARNQLNALIKGKHVRIHAIKSDQYGRTLAQVYLDQLLVNTEMLARGFAEAYIWGQSDIDAPAYRAAQRDAKDSQLGIWSLDEYESPQDFRSRTREP